MSNKPINYRLNDNDLLPLPSDEKLEKMILGLILDIPTLYDRCYKYLAIEGVFYNDQHTELWEAMHQVVSSKLMPSTDNMTGWFKRAGNPTMSVFVYSVAMGAGELMYIKQYCQKLFENATLRNIIRIGHDMNTKGYERTDALELLASASNGIGHIYEKIMGMRSKGISEGVDELQTELAAIAASIDGMLGIKGSIPFLNNILKGYRDGNMVVVGASSGEGKTTFMLQEVNHLVWQKIPVGVLSLEMTQSELLLKLACERTGLSIEKALSGTLATVEMQLLSTTLDSYKKLPLYITETPAMRIGEIKATARMWKTRYNIKMLFLDHMHLVNSDFQHGNAEQKFTDIANQIKELAKELDIPTMSLAQLARKDGLGEKRMHIMTDLKYAGGIEQAADVVLMIFRPEHHGIMTGVNGNSTSGVAILKVEKLRLLKTGSVKCNFDGLRFTQESFEDSRGNTPLPNAGNWKPVPYNSPLPNEIDDEPF